MTYFETPQDALAHACGLTVQQLESIQDAISADEEALYNMGQPHLDPEDRDLIPEDYVIDPAHTHVYNTTPDRGVWYCADCGVPLASPF